MQNAWWTKQSYKEKSVKNMKKKYAPVMSPCPLNVKMRSLRLAAVYECCWSPYTCSSLVFNFSNRSPCDSCHGGQLIML